MTKPKGAFLAVLGFAVLCISVALSMIGDGQAKAPQDHHHDGKDVEVVNGPHHPVPVVIGNGLDKCVPVMNCDAAGKHPWHNEWFFQLTATANEFQTITLPAGKRLVVEHVSAILDVDNGTIPDLAVFSTNPSQPSLSLRQHVLLTSIGQPFGRTRYIANQPMRSYIDSGSVYVSQWPTTTNVNGNVTLVGYLVDIP